MKGKRKRVIYWGIRRRSDGAFMPQGRGRGFTHDRPTFEKPPRLFVTRSAADRALDCWLLGDWSEGVETSTWDGETCDRYPSPPSQRPLDRVAGDMEVVAVVLEPKANG